MWVDYNPNPKGKRVGDCAVRAIAKALNIDWDESYINLIANGFSMADMPNAVYVYGSVLRKHGFVREIIPDNCPDGYTIKDFCIDHPKGTFVVVMSNHVVTVIDGNYYDSWNSGNEIPILYFRENKR